MKQKINLFTSHRMDEIQNIGFLGLGRIGLPQSLVFASKGLNVHGFDIDPLVIEGLKRSQIPFDEPSMDDYLANNLHRKFFPQLLASDSYEKLGTLDAIIFTLGTPAPINKICLENTKPDLSNHYSVINEIFKSNFRKGLVIIFRTTFPLGATDEIKRYIESAYPFTEGKDFHLAFVPERLMEGRAIVEEETLPKIIGTYNEKAFSLVKKLFERIGGKIIRVDNPRTAEFCKLADNSYRSTLFAFSNDLAMLGNEAGINALSAIHAINLGYFRNNLPAPGFVSGYCLGKDPYILEQSFKVRDSHSVWYAGRKTNDFLVNYVVRKVLQYLPQCDARRITILGLSFKENVDDFRMSHAISIIEQLIEMGITTIDVYDPNLNRNKYAQIPPHLLSVIDRSTNTLNPEFFSHTDAIIVCHRHKELMDVAEHQLPTLLLQINKKCYIFDAWNVWENAKNLKNVQYEGLGHPYQMASNSVKEEISIPYARL